MKLGCAPFCYPTTGARALKSLALPHAAATVARQATGTGGLLVSRRYADTNGSVLSDPALQIRRSVTKDVAIADLYAKTRRAFARAAMMTTLQLPS